RAISEREGPARWEADGVGRRAASRRRAKARQGGRPTESADAQRAAGERRPEPERERLASAVVRQGGVAYAPREEWWRVRARGPGRGFPRGRGARARVLARARHLREVARAAQLRPALRVLRGPAHRERAAAQRPRAHPRDEGRDPA